MFTRDELLILQQGLVLVRAQKLRFAKAQPEFEAVASQLVSVYDALEIKLRSASNEASVSSKK